MKIKLRDLTEEQYEKDCEKRICAECLFHVVECDLKYDNCWFKHKDLYSDKFLDQEIEIDEPILTDEERRYLRKIIEPYRDKVESIEKIGSEYLDSDNDFVVIHLEEDSISLPILNTSFKFNGMETDKEYTLEELEL